MSLTITPASQFDAKKIEFSAMRKGKMGNKTVYINTSDSKKLYVQLPFMRAPYGLSAYTDESTGKTSYSLDLSFDAENAEAIEFMKKLEELDNRILDIAAENSEQWLGKKFHRDVLAQALYKPLVRVAKDPQYPSTFKIKILTKPGGEFVPEVYNFQREQVDLDTLQKGQRCCAIVDFASLWFVDSKFGATVRLSQLLLDRSEKLQSFAFVGLNLPDAKAASSEEEEEEEDIDEGEE
ncbi:hypothetical protein DSLPV1_131 [Dishui lake phycodnavirus 1]|uniref:hypothetical protein n=1 Tax=Dishui lake phycodnavirus 1 TaxID=2079134 RepID=UPI000CD6C296|nr:hypothetical protein C5Y57_gp131 [Dishui lake phycodnavirus 1]AUT19102.1 hypothetical protein DSLPV1_131 [Dishui lake phycodnavirus 1]